MRKGILVLLGFLLIGIGWAMKSACTTKVIEGNQGATTVAGAAIGTATGVATGAAIGGVGVVACGTGVGIAIGYKSGTPDTFVTTLVYSPILSYTVMAIGVLLIIIAAYMKTPTAQKTELSPLNKENLQ